MGRRGNGEVGPVNFSLVQLECEGCEGVAEGEVTDNDSSSKNHKSSAAIA